MDKRRGSTPRAVLTVRLLIGAYLLYIDYDIFSDVLAREGASKVIMLAAMGIFAVVGVLLIVKSVKGLVGGDTKDDTPPSDDGSDDA